MSVLDVETEWLELLSELAVDSVLLDRLDSVELSDVADEVLLLDKVLVERLLAVDWLDSVIVCELLDVVIVWLLEGDDVLLLVVMLWLDELLEPVDSVERLDSVDIDWLDLLLTDWLLEEIELLDSVLVERLDAELVERLDAVLLLVERLLVLLVESELVLLVERLEVLDVLRLDTLLLDRELLLSVLVERLDVLDSLDSLISSTATIRRSWAIGLPCCWPLATIDNRASLVGKSRMAGVLATPPIVSMRMARQNRSFSSVTLTNSSVLLRDGVERWSVKLPLTAAKTFNSRSVRCVPPFPR